MLRSAPATAPTIPTLVMFPILVVVCVRLAKREEQMALAEFGDEYRTYMHNTPAWIPTIKTLQPGTSRT